MGARELKKSVAAARVGAVLAFLPCRTPGAWVSAALEDLDALLCDHATLELKAAQQAQKLIFRYGAARDTRAGNRDAAFRHRLLHRMSRLAREELRHFEQVVALLQRRGGTYRAVSPSRYAAGLHALARGGDPGALVDALIIGALIEARSCERFFSLLEPLATVDAELAGFYASLLRAEARHFEDYLALARSVDPDGVDDRIETFRQRDAELVLGADSELRFHSGPPVPATARLR